MECDTCTLKTEKKKLLKEITEDVNKWRDIQ